MARNRYQAKRSSAPGGGGTALAGAPAAGASAVALGLAGGRRRHRSSLRSQHDRGGGAGGRAAGQRGDQVGQHQRRRRRPGRSSRPGSPGPARRTARGRTPATASGRPRCPPARRSPGRPPRSRWTARRRRRRAGRRVKPRVFSSAKSRRRRRTDAISVRPSPATAPAARPPARMAGIAPMRLVVHDLGRPLHRQHRDRVAGTPDVADDRLAPAASGVSALSCPAICCSERSPAAGLTPGRSRMNMALGPEIGPYSVRSARWHDLGGEDRAGAQRRVHADDVADRGQRGGAGDPQPHRRDELSLGHRHRVAHPLVQRGQGRRPEHDLARARSARAPVSGLGLIAARDGGGHGRHRLPVDLDRREVDPGGGGHVRGRGPAAGPAHRERHATRSRRPSTARSRSSSRTGPGARSACSGWPRTSAWRCPPATASTVPAMTDRTGTAVRPRPGSRANRRPAPARGRQPGGQRRGDHARTAAAAARTRRAARCGARR